MGHASCSCSCSIPYDSCHCHLHGASSETVPMASHCMVHATLSNFIVPSSQPHDSFEPTSSYFLSEIRGYPPLSLTHNFWLSQGLISPLCNMYCSGTNPCGSYAVVYREFLPDCLLTAMSAMGFKAEIQRGPLASLFSTSLQ